MKRRYGRLLAMLLSFCLGVMPLLTALAEGETGVLEEESQQIFEEQSTEPEAAPVEEVVEIQQDNTVNEEPLQEEPKAPVEEEPQREEEEISVPEESQQKEPETSETENPQQEEKEVSVSEDPQQEEQEVSVSEDPQQEEPETPMTEEIGQEDGGDDESAQDFSEVEINTQDETAEEEKEQKLPDEEEEVTEVLFEEETAIDFSKPASESPLFESGYAEVLHNAEVFATAKATEKIGVLVSGIVEVKARENRGEDQDFLLVIFTADEKEIKGYVSAEDVRPCSAEELARVQDSSLEVVYIPEEIESAQDFSEVEIIVQDETAEEEKEWELPDEEQEVIEILFEEETIPEEIDAEAISDVKARNDEDVEELEIEVPNEVGDLFYTAVEGDVILSAGTTSSIMIAQGAGKQANAYYNMTTAGLLTLAFKAAEGANGNLTITVKSYKDDVVWSDVWAVNTGTYNCSYFLEADEYTIIIGKSDPTDDAAYYLSVTPTVSRTGELGTRNNSIAYAAAATVGGGVYTGIVSLQDVNSSKSDYYSFTLDSPGQVSISFTNKTTDDMGVSILGSDEASGSLTVIESFTAPKASDRSETSTTTVNNSRWLDAGKYYLQADASVDGRYSFSISSSSITITEKEPDNSFNQAYNSANELKLNGTEITGLLSKSDGVDCYYFKLDGPTRISFSVKVQMTGASAAIYTRDGVLVSGSKFGKDNANGSDGNPAEMELKNFLVDGSGYYYLKVGYDSYNDTGKYSVSAKAQITASTLKVTVKDAIATIKATSMPLSITPKAAYIHIFEYIGGNPYELKTLFYTGSAGKDITYQYTIPEGGNYAVQYVVTDGTVWSEKWASFTSSLPAFEITTINASVDSSGKITCSAAYIGNGNLIDSAADLYKNGVLIETKQLKGGTTWTFNAPATGTYTIHFAGTLTGAAWKEGWRQIDVNVPVTLPLSIASLNVSTNKNGLISCSATTKDGKALQSFKFVLYSGSTILQTVNASSSGTGSFTVTKSGTYTIQCVAYDGITWADAWKSCTVTISGSAPLTIDTLSASADGSGNVTLLATTKDGGTLTFSAFVIYNNSGKEVAKVNATNGKATAKVYSDGVYGVQYVASDGATWTDKWVNVTVKLTGSDQMPVITSLNATANSAGAIMITSDYTTGKALKSLNYYVFDASDNSMLNYVATVNSKSVTLYVTKSGNYIIHAVATDGTNWADKWTTVTVTMSGSGSTALSIDSLVLSVTGPTSFHMKGVTNDNRALTVSRFVIYKDGNIVKTIDAAKKEADCSGLAAGVYGVQYVVSDGSSWVDKWDSITVGTSGLTIDSMTTSKSGTKYTVQATVTNNLEIKTVVITLYDDSNKIAAKWTWNGTGNYLKHDFVVDESITVNCAQYVISDGVEWKDEWKNF